MPCNILYRYHQNVQVVPIFAHLQYMSRKENNFTSQSSYTHSYVFKVPYMAAKLLTETCFTKLILYPNSRYNLNIANLSISFTIFCRHSFKLNIHF